jgi:hypothetical protein
MPSAALFTSFFQCVAIVGSALTVWKLLTTGLYRRYRIFFAYFLLRVPFMTFFLVLLKLGGSGSTLYYYSFVDSQPFLLVAYILVVVELYSLALEPYPGISTLGRWFMCGAVVVAGLASVVVTLLPKIRPAGPQPSKRLAIQLAAERGVDLALVFFILLIIFFLAKFPVPLGRNVVVHTVIYFLFFLSDTVALLWWQALGHKVSAGFNLVATAVASACSVAWWL